MPTKIIHINTCFTRGVGKRQQILIDMLAFHLHFASNDISHFLSSLSFSKREREGERHKLLANCLLCSVVISLLLLLLRGRRSPFLQLLLLPIFSHCISNRSRRSRNRPPNKVAKSKKNQENRIH